MNDHIQVSALEAYVTGELDDEASAMVETHVSACAACANRLMGEAQVEVAFAQVAERSVLQTERRVSRRSSFAAGAAIAMAAGVLLFLAPAFGRGGHDNEPPTPGSSLGNTPAVAFDRPIAVDADASASTAQLERAGDAAFKLGRD